jgi:hypothetical protein
MIKMGDNVRSAEGRRFHHGKTVRELEARFAQEDMQGTFPSMANNVLSVSGERKETDAKH